jgi:acyl dehydratase
VSEPQPVEVGQELPAFTRVTGFEVWNRYAAVNDEFVPIHMDDEAGRSAGYPTAFGMGNLLLSYLHSLLRQWLGDDGEILRVSCQFRGPNLKGQTVTARGVVTAVDRSGPRQVVELDVWTEDQDGNRLSPGRARVAMGW